MKRRFVLGTLLALVLVIGFAVAAMAADPGPNYGNGPQMDRTGEGAAQHGDFVDADADGACDNFALRTPAQDGDGNQWGRGQARHGARGVQNANFVDEDGDGLCDNCLDNGLGAHNGQGNRMQQGRRWNQ